PATFRWPNNSGPRQRPPLLHLQVVTNRGARQRPQSAALSGSHNEGPRLCRGICYPGDRWSHAFASLSSSAFSTGSSERASDQEPGPAAGYDIQSTPTGQTLDSDDALALDVVDLSVLIVVMVVIGVISVAAMVV